MPETAAAILAGGTWKGGAPSGFSEWRALALLNGRPLIQYVVEALNTSAHVDRVFLVGPAILEEACPGIVRLDSSDRLTDNVMLAARSVQPQDRLLLVGCDIPLLTGTAVDDFLTRCAGTEARAYFPYIDKTSVEARFPGMSRTYVKLRGGAYTGGNLLLADPAFLLTIESLVQELFNARKKPLQLARLLGAPLLIRFLLTAVGLPVLDAEGAAALMGRRLHTALAAVLTPFAEIGADLDAVEEVSYYERLLTEAGRGSPGAV